MFRPISPSNTSPTKTPQPVTYTLLHCAWQNKVQAEGVQPCFQFTGWGQVPGTCRCSALGALAGTLFPPSFLWLIPQTLQNGYLIQQALAGTQSPPALPPPSYLGVVTFLSEAWFSHLQLR